MLPAATAWLALAVALAGPAASEDSYEWRRTKVVLDADGLEVDPNPEGKRIAYVRIVRDEVFVKGEVFPLWFNLFHVRTRERIVKRELLLGVGDAYVDERIEESMRILRRMGIFALVRIVAVRTADPDAVGLLVHTRDIWSLRLETKFNISSQINSLNISLTERNVAGLGHEATIPFSLRPDTWTISESYGTRRTFGYPVAVGESGGVIFNRDSNRPEGGFGSVGLRKPFYNLAQRHSFSLSGSYSTRIRRQLANGVAQAWFPDGQDEAAGVRVWRQQNISGRVAYAMRSGDKRRHTVTISLTASDRQVEPVAESAVDSSLHAAFLDEVPPPARREIGPRVTYGMFVPRYKVFTNLDTYGQSENVRLGPFAEVSFFAPLKLLGSTVEARTAALSVGWTWAPMGGLIRISGGPRTRWQEGVWSDHRVSATVRTASPMVGPVRFVARSRLSMRWEDTTNGQVSLGSDNGLRGYPSDHLIDFGANWFLTNFEVRTKPIEWRAVHIGGVAFYDMGSVFESFGEMRLTHGFGIGLRVLFPQLNRDPWTLDAGFPDDSFRAVPTLRSSQVVPMN